MASQSSALECEEVEITNPLDWPDDGVGDELLKVSPSHHEDHTALQKVFRYALAKVLNLDETGEGALAAILIRLEEEAKAHIPEAILTVLSRLVEAEKAAVGKTAGGGGAQGGGRGGRGRGDGGTRGGTGRKSRRLQSESGKKARRVSFSTFDLSAIDTPDPQRHGSDRPMESVLFSLFLVLKSAETLREECCGSSMDGGSPVHKGGELAATLHGAGKENALSASLSAAASWADITIANGGGSSSSSLSSSIQLSPIRQQNGNNQQQQSQDHNKSQQKDGILKKAVEDPPAAAISAAASSISSSNAIREYVEKLLTALSDLASYCSSTAAAQASEVNGAATTTPPTAIPAPPRPGIMNLLGEHPNWSELGAAANLYASELRLLCLGAAETLHFSRLLNRYHETVSSLVRYEMKKVLNLCYCANDGGEDGTTPLPRRGDGFGLMMIDQHAEGEGEEGMVNCCSALAIMAEYNNLQYNSDDPAALVHFALDKIYSNEDAWKALRETASQEKQQQDEEDQQHQEAKEGLGEEPCGGWDGESKSAEAFEAEEVSVAKEKGGHDDAEDGSNDCSHHQQKRRAGGGEKKADSSSNSSTLISSTPKWWAIADSRGQDILSYLGAASFLYRVLYDPVVVQAVSNGRWGRVERLAGMVSCIMGVPSEEDSLRPLKDIATLKEDLEVELRAAEDLREVLLASTPQEILACLPSSHGGSLPPRRKRKRAARSLSAGFRDVLVWARTDELPMKMTYPTLAPLCVYAANQYLVDDEDDLEEEDEALL